nr:type VI secretion system contractile sheath small subunit [Salinicola tamaricis]
MAKNESTQHKLSRVRAPRVHLTYDVEIGDSIEKKELPFVVGVMGDYTGNPLEPLPRLKDRKFVNIDRDNFDSVMKGVKPRLSYRVDNTLANDGSQLPVELNFKRMEDFEPQEVVRQVEPLRKLLDVRNKLADLRNKMGGNDKLEELLMDVLQNTEKLKARAKSSAAKPLPNRRTRRNNRSHSWPRIRPTTSPRAKTQEVFAPETSLLDSIISESRVARSETERTRTRDLIDELVHQVLEGEVTPSKDLIAVLDSRIAEIDSLLSDQLNEIMHASEFQQLEASWRGLKYLTDQSETSTNMKIHMLNASKKDLVKDLKSASEFDQSALFKKIYEEYVRHLRWRPLRHADR